MATQGVTTMRLIDRHAGAADVAQTIGGRRNCGADDSSASPQFTVEKPATLVCVT